MSEQRKKYLDENYHIDLYKNNANLAGWFIEYHTMIGNKSKFIGKNIVSGPDRTYIGYNGKKYISGEELPKELYKRAYKGLQVTSLLYPLNK